eukprot:CAMPEP_0202891550 /NCGR_PEP_ID=MMETSP1392-20130828/1585_1 /ASSEMBLY_ACC=CAM_ASM_000868 /TAXON_ID=225041 /ORGANISM="Chlamydomonas chlamydogama, Strain SAG 11-48b" /LENGTH=58 /DNA_ID=CAMNT_0049575339 /DNA_START=106 /DNA_END=282 /DNA_ORIENTATION=-
MDILTHNRTQRAQQQPDDECCQPTFATLLQLGVPGPGGEQLPVCQVFTTFMPFRMQPT